MKSIPLPTFLEYLFPSIPFNLIKTAVVHMVTEPVPTTAELSSSPPGNPTTNKLLLRHMYIMRVELLAGDRAKRDEL